jgi:hypothetical protein
MGMVPSCEIVALLASGCCPLCLWKENGLVPAQCVPVGEA